jgi:hypothetical protein
LAVEQVVSAAQQVRSIGGSPRAGLCLIARRLFFVEQSAGGRPAETCILASARLYNKLVFLSKGPALIHHENRGKNVKKHFFAVSNQPGGHDAVVWIAI